MDAPTYTASSLDPPKGGTSGFHVPLPALWNACPVMPSIFHSGEAYSSKVSWQIKKTILCALSVSSDPERVEGGRALNVQSFANKLGMHQFSVRRAKERAQGLASEKHLLLDVETNA
jgi:hypothetical protein